MGRSENIYFALHLSGIDMLYTKYDSKKPHEKCGAFVRQVTIILLTALTNMASAISVPVTEYE